MRTPEDGELGRRHRRAETGPLGRGRGGALQPLPQRHLRTCPSRMQLQPQSLKMYFLPQGGVFPVLHNLQVHENYAFQLFSSTEKWSEVFLSESIFLSNEISPAALQPISMRQ